VDLPAEVGGGGAESGDREETPPRKLCVK
jgi:hypothetical protein